MIKYPNDSWKSICVYFWIFIFKECILFLYTEKNNISDLSGQDFVLHIRGNVLHRKKKSGYGYWKYIFLMLCGLHIAVRKN